MGPEELPSETRPLVRSAAERIAVIIEAAEKAAASVIDDAEEEAQRYLDDARARADRIVAERLRSLADEIDPADPGRPHLRPVEAPDAGDDGDEADSAARLRARSGPAAARLLATQMAVSGSSREEIEARLRKGFEIEDTAGILDAILGPEG